MALRPTGGQGSAVRDGGEGLAVGGRYDHHPAREVCGAAGLCPPYTLLGPRPRWSVRGREGVARLRVETWGGRAAHRRLDEVAERDVEGVCDEQQISERRHAGGVLVPVDRLVITPDALAELYLREARVYTCVADACPDYLAAGGYPWRHRVERHPPTFERSWS